MKGNERKLKGNERKMKKGKEMKGNETLEPRIWQKKLFF